MHVIMLCIIPTANLLNSQEVVRIFVRIRSDVSNIREGRCTKLTGVLHARYAVIFFFINKKLKMIKKRGITRNVRSTQPRRTFPDRTFLEQDERLNIVIICHTPAHFVSSGRHRTLSILHRLAHQILKSLLQ